MPLADALAGAPVTIFLSIVNGGCRHAIRASVHELDTFSFWGLGVSDTHLIHEMQVERAVTVGYCEMWRRKWVFVSGEARHRAPKMADRGFDTHVGCEHWDKHRIHTFEG